MGKTGMMCNSAEMGGKAKGANKGMFENRVCRSPERPRSVPKAVSGAEAWVKREVVVGREESYRPSPRKASRRGRIHIVQSMVMICCCIWIVAIIIRATSLSASSSR